MKKLKWTVYWSCGPMDNPGDGEFFIEADTIEDVLAELEIRDFYNSYHALAIDGIMRSDLFDQ